MSAPEFCPNCGCPLADDQIEGLCLKCVVQYAVPVASGPVIGEDFGGYRILGLLGEGGMGAVYEAEQRETGRRVAVKVMRHRLASESERKRFLREGRVAASVNHPNLVYVFGSEEIDGNMVIVMELLGGGTLRDRVRREGPLPAAEAVEIILKIIDGLEALAAAGVLHRDLKPANVFIATDGMVKVGDFGLSISTRRRGESVSEAQSSTPGAPDQKEPKSWRDDDSVATVRGAPKGTPAYASPEQWRGDQSLDVRTDIYAVGATLYELLTGKAPDRPPVSPARGRSGIPRSLARVIMRCLATEREGRYANYDKLRRALLPFTSTALAPATLGLRFAAGVVDYVITALCLFIVTQELYIPPLEVLGAANLGIWPVPILRNTLLLILYFTISEWRWASSPGKALFGLLVATRSGQPMRIGRALWRASLFLLPIMILPLSLIPAIFSRESLTQATAGSFQTVIAVYCLGFLVLFATMRRANGFAAMHDLLSGTRVLRRRHGNSVAGARTRSINMPQLVPSDATRLGPYAIIAPLCRTKCDSLWLGYDETLRRPLWIHRLPAGAPPVSAQRRAIARPGRLRWLSGERTDSENWDAYEAVDGQPFVVEFAGRELWANVRLWLNDLAEEYRAGLEDGTLPTIITPDRIWITNGGRAVLLDFPCPGDEKLQSPLQLSTPPSVDSMQCFLNEVAEVALARNRIQLALPAQLFLSRLRECAFETADGLVASSRSLLSGPGFVTRLRRMTSMAAWPCGVGLMALLLAIPEAASQRREDLKLRPDARKFKYLLEARLQIRTGLGVPNPDIGKQMDQRIAGEFKHLIADQAFWDLVPKWQMGMPRRLAENALTSFPNPTPDELRAAVAATDPLLAFFSFGSGRFHHLGPWLSRRVFWMGSKSVSAWFAVLFLLDLFWIIARGEALILRWFGLALVTRAGLRASRFRVFSRAAIAWIGVFVCVAYASSLLFGPPLWTKNSGTDLDEMAGLALASVGLFILALCMARPNRSPQDYLAGTSLVLR